MHSQRPHFSQFFTLEPTIIQCNKYVGDAFMQYLSDADSTCVRFLIKVIQNLNLFRPSWVIFNIWP
jgi:hypothetical protein